MPPVTAPGAIPDWRGAGSGPDVQTNKLYRMEKLLKALRSLLMAMALLAMLALPAMAQNGSITIAVDCGAPESVTVTNDTDATLTLEGVNSSVDMVGNPEIDVNTEITAGTSATESFGTSSGSGNIFANGEGEDAIVFISGKTYTVNCGDEDFGEDTFQVGDVTEATPTPEPPIDPTPTPETPGKMPPTGGGGLATGASVPWGTMSLAASGLLAAGYAVLRRR